MQRRSSSLSGNPRTEETHSAGTPLFRTATSRQASEISALWQLSEVRAVHRWLRRLASPSRSEEHTSELQSHSDLVCRLLLEKKKSVLEERRALCRVHLAYRLVPHIR